MAIHHAALKIRLVVAFAMLVLGFIGVLFTNISRMGAWDYWRFIAVVYAILSLVLSWHLKRKEWKKSLITLWHEIAHWVGLMGAIFISSYFVRMGLVGRFEASVLTLLLLALATYLAGVYIEPTFLFVGAMLGIFCLGIAFLDVYFYNILLPFTLLVFLGYVIFIRHAHKNGKLSANGESFSEENRSDPKL